MITYFMSSEFTMSDKIVQIMYMLSGLFCIYSGVCSFKKKANKYYIPTAVFWTALGIVVAFGLWIPPVVNGVIVIVICIPAALNMVKPGGLKTPSKEEQQANFNKIGMKLFIPALGAGVLTLIISLFFTNWNSLVGSLLATVIGLALLMIWNKENKPLTVLEEGRRFLDLAGAPYTMPMLLACLGAIFTEAGVGDAFAELFGNLIPEGNIYVGIVAYAVGMALFTIIMGNAFAAITVLTVGIGVPFVIEQGGNPLVMVTLAMTCGYCGTLVTPMAANFNIVPGIFLEVKDKYGLIKAQVIPALLMLVFQIGYMLIAAK